jgi:hypothetical protein
MKIGIIVTDGGPHSPEKMATACAGALLSFDPSKLDGTRLLAAQRLEMAVVEALVPHHASVMETTRNELIANSAAHFAKGNLHDPGPALDEAVAAVLAAADATEWGPAFRDPDKLAQMRQVIGQFLVDSAHIERCWHSDRNPRDALAAAYKAAPAGILLAPMTEAA